MAQKAHVPKFGNWERDSVPYTVYFENARKGKAGGRRMNPNDPEDNPEVFKALAGTPESHNKPVCKSKGGISSLDLDHPHQPHRAKLGRKKGSNGSYSSFSSSTSAVPPSHQTDKNPPSANLTQPQHRRAASIPKFGAWDTKEPTSGEGFTVIFNKAKQEKNVRTINLPCSTQPPSKSTYSTEKLKSRSRLASKVPKFLRISCCFLR